jgi:hypothetical protein
MDERLKALSRKGAEIAADPNRDSPPVAQRHIDRFRFIQDSLRKGELFVRLRDGWVVMVGCSGRLTEEVGALCSLVSPDGDGYWSGRGAVTTVEAQDVLTELAVNARSGGFHPPCDAELRRSIPGNWVEICIGMIRDEALQAEGA